MILASASPRRLDLLRQIGIEPDQIVVPDIDETPLAGESPRAYALRIVYFSQMRELDESLTLRRALRWPNCVRVMGL